MKIACKIAAMLTLIFFGDENFISAQISSEPYTWRNVVMGGGGFVTGILFHPAQRDLIYARTDVGGAYRWDGAKWIPLTDWLQGIDFTGIESFALDPRDTNRIYLAAGIYRGTRAAILRSDDRGRTWRQTEVPFKMGGNESGRFNGERLAVNPQDGNILFFGSRHDGLWKSLDRGASWTNVLSFPQIAPEPPPPARTNSTRRFRGNFSPAQIGIVCVQFSGKNIYAAVSTTGTNFFRSDDGGQNWSAVPGQPLGSRPNHATLAPDGNFFLTYGKQPGPESMTDGAVWKFDPATGAWTDITPATVAQEAQPFGYGDVAVDAKNSSNLVVTTFAHWRPHDEIFRSTNGGLTWTRLLENAQWNFAGAPYTQKRTPHWMGTIAIDPFDSNRVLFTTGYGIWASENLTDADRGGATRWNFFDRGLEETVPLALISPPAGAHLLSGVGDIDGFRHDDLDVSPAEGNFSGPRFSHTESLAFAAKQPEVIVRAGVSADSGPRAAISRDGGKTWELSPANPASGGNSGNVFFGNAGTITISADAKNLVWTLRRAASAFSGDAGKTWTPCAGLADGARVVADSVNENKFYAFDPAGKIFISTNGAANFFATPAVLPAGNFGGTLAAAPGREGDLWLATADGVFHSTDGGNNFTKLEKIRDANSIGFGHPAPGESFPAIFLIGAIEDMRGIFRSDDGGENWIRINDDTHQFGGISRVAGDPRVFGRVYFATGGRGVIYGEPAK